MIAQVVAAGAGVVVMACPSVFGYGDLAADLDHIMGPLSISVGIMAASQILRAIRWIDLGLGMALLASLPLMARGTTGSIAIALAAGILIVSAFVRGTVDVELGGGWRALRRSHDTVV